LALEGDRRRAFFAEHPLPLLKNSGGPTIANPRVIAVFFGQHPLRQAIEAMLQSYGCSAAWRDTVAEYGIGDATYERTVELPAPPPLHDETEVSDWLTKQVEAKELGPVTHENVIVFFPPEGTKWLSDDCVDRLGYHGEMAAGDGHFPYAVLLQCPTPARISRLDQMTHEISHELIEVATDPFPASAPAWRGLDHDESAWAAVDYANENADFCDDRSFARADFPVATATAWSNRRARAGLDPCGPSPYPFAAVGARHKQIDLSNGPVDLDIDVYDEDPEVDLAIVPSVSEPRACVWASYPLAHRDGSVATMRVGAFSSVSPNECDPPLKERELRIAGMPGLGLPSGTTVKVTGIVPPPPP
jgi:hypothetical protein